MLSIQHERPLPNLVNVVGDFWDTSCITSNDWASSFCLMIGPLSLQKRTVHRMRSSASSFSFKSLIVSLRSTRCSLHFFLLFPSPLSLLQEHVLEDSFTQGVTNPVSLLFTVRRIFLSSLTLSNTSFFRSSTQLIFSILPSTTFQNSQGSSDLLSEVSNLIGWHRVNIDVNIHGHVIKLDHERRNYSRGNV